MPLPMLKMGRTNSIASTISTTRLVVRSDSFCPTLQAVVTTAALGHMKGVEKRRVGGRGGSHTGGAGF